MWLWLWLFSQRIMIILTLFLGNPHFYFCVCTQYYTEMEEWWKTRKAWSHSSCEWWQMTQLGRRGEGPNCILALRRHKYTTTWLAWLKSGRIPLFPVSWLSWVHSFTFTIIVHSLVVDVWHGKSELWGPERACCVQWRQPQVSAYSVMVLDYSQQFYPRRDGSTSPVCDGLLPAPSWWFQGALSAIPNHCSSHTWDATHGTHMVRMRVLGDTFEIFLTFFCIKKKNYELRICVRWHPKHRYFGV